MIHIVFMGGGLNNSRDTSFKVLYNLVWHSDASRLSLESRILNSIPFATLHINIYRIQNPFLVLDFSINGPRREKTYLRMVANNKGAFSFRFLESVTTSEISTF